jgi:hypothetical protein
VWWIDSPRGTIHQWGFLRRRGIVSDLASLDKGGSSLCSRSERLRFIRQYAHAHGPDPRLRKLVRRILAYARRRWPGYRPRPAPRASDAQ